MTVLKDYEAFAGWHYETGSVHNVLAYQNVTVPQTGKVFSEALLLGLSGGIAFGYFTFEYKGQLPYVALLTRNTFDPVETLFNRLAAPRDVRRTLSAEKGMKNLLDVLEAGQPALVWVDVFSLPYRLLPSDSQMWSMQPIVVFGVDEGEVLIADCSNKPFRVSLDDFEKARARTKKNRFKLIALDSPNLDALPVAVEEGIRQCLALFLDAPPKGKKDNFGLAALEYWAKMLVNTRNKRSWERVFPAGAPLFSALAGRVGQPGGFDWLTFLGAADGAERGVYADFLDEAGLILAKSDLSEVASKFRVSAGCWRDLAVAMLPDEVPLLKEVRDLKVQKHELYVEEGMNALGEIKSINLRLNGLGKQAAEDFPVSDVIAFREGLSEHVLKILEVEKEAVMCLKEIIE